MKTISSLKNKKIILRLDLNVPIKNGKVTGFDRINAALPTLRLLLKNNNSIIIISHLGRPKGKEKSLSLKPVSKQLSGFLKKEIKFSASTDTDMAVKAAKKLELGQVLMLENLRFYPGEEDNSTGFAKHIASMGEIYVNDAFSASHRKHASIVGIPKYLKAYPGLQFEREVKNLMRLQKPKRPYLAIIGGSKISTKIGLLKKLSERADDVFVGGAMIFTILKAQGYEVGKSLVENDKLRTAKRLAGKVTMPKDVVVSHTVSATSKHQNKRVDEMKRTDIGLDIGKESTEELSKLIRKAKTILWNGPLGLFELKPYAKASRKAARAITNSGAFSVVGGGDTVSLIDSIHLRKKFSYVSTAGGAMLEFLEKGTLPGIVAVEKRMK